MFLTQVFVCMVALLVASVLLIYIGNQGYSFGNLCAEVTGALGIFGVVVMSVYLLCQLFSWRSAEQEAKLINKQYGTEYTTEDLYWAKDVIDTVREIERKRIEVNGNLFSNKNEE